MASDPNAVHCPQCGVEPEIGCHDDGVQRKHAHASRKQLASALVNPDLKGRGTAAAQVYRQIFPDVDATAIRCIGTKSQRAWRNRWRKLHGRPDIQEGVCQTPDLHAPGGPNEGRAIERGEPIALPAASAEPSVSDALKAAKQEAERNEAVRRKPR